MPISRKCRKNGPIRRNRGKLSKSSPRENRRSPQLAKKFLPPRRQELNYLEIAERHDRYLRVFSEAGVDFWRAIEGIRGANGKEIGERGYVLADEAIRRIPKHLLRFLPTQLSEWRQPTDEWKQPHIRIKRLRLPCLPEQMSKTLIKAVRESGKNGFPRDREKRAEFLAKSLARNGNASARTSRDNCLKARRRLEKPPQPEETPTTEGYILSSIA